MLLDYFHFPIIYKTKMYSQEYHSESEPTPVTTAWQSPYKKEESLHSSIQT